MVALAPVTITPEPGYVLQLRAHGRELLTPLLDESFVTASHADLVRAARLIVQLTALDTDKPWPSKATHLLALVGELALILVCEHRDHPRTDGGLRAVLRQLLRVCQATDVPSFPPTPLERIRQYLALFAIHVASAELKTAATQSPSLLGEPNR